MPKWLWPIPPKQDPAAVVDAIVKLWGSQLPPDADIPRKLVIAEKSLKEVTRLTGYEDEKANRIFTAIAFLSAFAAVMFTETYKEFPIPVKASAGCLWGLLTVVPYLYFALFTAYALCMTWGAVLVLRGIFPQFNIHEVSKSDTVQSLLFYQLILASSADVWGKTFRDKSPAELERTLFQNCVLESYLVAGKIPHKIAFVRLGTAYFYASTIILMVWTTFTVVAELFFKLV